MMVLVKIGEDFARKFYIAANKKVNLTPGDKFLIVDKKGEDSKPLLVQLREIKVHIGGGDIYFVDKC